VALKVGDLYASIRINDSEFNAGLDRAERKFGGLRSVVSSGAQVLANAFAGTVTALAGLGTAAFTVGVNYNRLQQSSRAALETLLGSTEAVNAQMAKLDEFAKTSPFAKQVFITAQQQLLAFGMEAEKVIPTLDAVQNAVAAAGGSSQQLSDVVFVLAQIQAAGKITGQDLLQLGQRGINAAELIGSSLGMTGAEVKESITAGALDAQVAIDALVAGMDASFGGATANLKKQMDGAVDRVKGAWRDIGSILAAPFVDPNGGGRAVEWANLLADALRALETKARPVVELLVDRFSPGLNQVTTLLEQALGVVNRWDLSKLNGQLDTLTSYAPLVGGLSAALFAMGAKNLPLLSLLGIQGISPLAAGLSTLVALSPPLRGAFSDALAAAAPLLPMFTDLGRAAMDLAMAVLERMSPAFGALLTSGTELAVTLGTALLPAITGLVNGAMPLVDVLARVVEWVAALPAPVLAMVAALVLSRGAFDGANASAEAAGLAVLNFGQRARIHAALGATNVAMGAMSVAMVGIKGAAAGAGAALKAAFISNPIGLAITGLVTVLTIFGQRSQEAQQKADELRATLDQQTGAWTDNTREMLANKLQQEGVLDAARLLGLEAGLVTAAILGEGNARAELNQILDEHLELTGSVITGSTPQVDAANRVADATARWTRELDAQGDKIRQVAEEAGTYGRATDDAAIATSGLAGEAESATAALKALREEQNASAQSALSLRESQLRVEDAQQRVQDAIASWLEISADENRTEAEKAEAKRRVEQAILDTIPAYTTVIDNMRKQNATSAEVYAAQMAQRDAFVANATQMGLTAAEAEALADSYGLIPERVTTIVVAETKDAAGNITAIQRQIDVLTGRVYTVRVNAVTGAQTGFSMGRGVLAGEADGGVLEFYRAGGLRRPEQHVAQIAPAGAWRVWAEPETGGEAYVPLAPSKRARSLAVMDEVASRFGFQLIPAGAPAFANGSPAPAQAASSSTRVLNYYAAPNSSLSAEEELFAAAGRARMAGW
jgi:tape measure domain-containing protein